MRIALLTRDHPPTVCGVGDYTRRLAGALVERAHEVTVVTRRHDNPRACDPVRDGLTDTTSGVSTVHVGARWRGFEAVAIARAVRALRVERVIVQFSPYAHGRFGVGWFAPLLLVLLRCTTTARVSVTFHEMYGAWPSAKLPWALVVARMVVGLAQRAQLLVLAWCASDLVASTRERSRRLARIVGKRRVGFVPIGFAPRIHAVNAGERRVVRRALGAADTTTIVVTFGSLQACKQYEALIDAIGDLVDGGDDVHLWWLGDLGAAPAARLRAIHERIVRRALGARVHLLGFVADGDVGKYLAAADVYVHPDADGAGTKSSTLAGGLAHGLPVLAAHGRDTDAAVFAHGSNVHLVAHADRACFTEGLRVLVRSPALRTRLGERARATFARHLTWSAIAAAYDSGGGALPRDLRGGRLSHAR